MDWKSSLCGFSTFLDRGRIRSLPTPACFPSLSSPILRGTTPTIFGDGEQSRDFTYVANVVDATLRACVASAAPGKVINVGTGVSSTLNQTIKVLNAMLGLQVQPQYAAPRVGDVRHSTADDFAGANDARL